MRSGAAEQRDERLPVNTEVGYPIPVAKIKRAEIVRLTLREMAGVARHPGEPRELRIAFAGCAGPGTSKPLRRRIRLIV